MHYQPEYGGGLEAVPGLTNLASGVYGISGGGCLSKPVVSVEKAGS